MIIEFDQNDNLTPKEQVRSLRDSVQRAFNETQEMIEEIESASGNGGGGSGGGGSGGTNNYNELINKPKIESVMLQGNKSFSDLGLESMEHSDIDIIVYEIE